MGEEQVLAVRKGGVATGRFLRDSAAAISERIVPLLSSRRWPLVLAVIGFGASLPAIWVAPFNDDLVHWAMLIGPSPLAQQLSQEGLAPAESGRLGPTLSDLFIAVHPRKNLRSLTEYGALPWWTYEEHQVAFWRPLASFTQWLDYRLFPGAFALMHLHSILWFSMVVLAAAALYRRFIGVSWIAGLAGLFYVLDDSSYFPTMWVANRNLLLSLCFGLLAVMAHDRWRRQGHRSGAVLEPLCLLLSLLSGEAGVATFAYLFAYEAVLQQGRWVRRALSLVPSLAVIVGWRLLYNLQGYGANGGGFYFDPAREPVAYALALLKRAPFLLVGQWTTMPPELYSFLSPPYRALAWIVLAVLTVLIPLGLLPMLRANRRARFWLAGMCVAAAPFCATIPMGRSLLFVSIGGFALIAEFVAGWLRRENWVPTSGPGRWLIGAIAITFLMLHLPWTALWRGYAPHVASDVQKRISRTMVLGSIECLPSDDLVVVNAPNPIAFLYDPYESAYEGRSLPRAIRMLAPGFGPIEVVRMDARRLVLKSVSESFFDCRRGKSMDYAFFYRCLSDVRGAGHPFHVGQRISLPRLDVEILAVDERGLPLELAFTFDVPLEDASLKWLYWNWGKKRYKAFDVPAIGETMRLAGPFRPLQAPQ